MNKIVLFSAAACAAITFSACSSSKESAYRKAYEKAKAQEAVQTYTTTQQETASNTQETPVVTPLVEAPATTQSYSDNSNVTVRTESVEVVNGAGLKAYSVVVGSYGVKANAENHQQRLKSAGYNSQIAYNPSNKMYRVIATTFDTKEAAAESRYSLSSTYSDAWLLFNK